MNDGIKFVRRVGKRGKEERKRRGRLGKGVEGKGCVGGH